MQHEMYSVYVKTDETGRIVAVNSDAFLSSMDGWQKVDEGRGDKFHHAQGNYLEMPLTDENGVYRYELKNGKIKERKKKDMEADVQEQPKHPTQEERLERLENAITAISSVLEKFGVKL